MSDPPGTPKRMTSLRRKFDGFKSAISPSKKPSRENLLAQQVPRTNGSSAEDVDVPQITTPQATTEVRRKVQAGFLDNILSENEAANSAFGTGPYGAAPSGANNQAVGRHPQVELNVDNHRPRARAVTVSHSRSNSQAITAQDTEERVLPKPGQYLQSAPNKTRGRSSFGPGQIILAWHNIQNVDEKIPVNISYENVLSYSLTNKGNWVHTKKRPFVVLMTYNTGMIALPIRTNGGRGLEDMTNSNPFYTSLYSVKWKGRDKNAERATSRVVLETEELINERSTVGIKDAVILDYREEIKNTGNQMTDESTEALIEMWLDRAVVAVGMDAEREDFRRPNKRRRFDRGTLRFDPGPGPGAPGPPDPSGSDPSGVSGPSNPSASGAAGVSVKGKEIALQEPQDLNNLYSPLQDLRMRSSESSG